MSHSFTDSKYLTMCFLPFFTASKSSVVPSVLRKFMMRSPFGVFITSLSSATVSSVSTVASGFSTNCFISGEIPGLKHALMTYSGNESKYVVATSRQCVFAMFFCFCTASFGFLLFLLPPEDTGVNSFDPSSNSSSTAPKYFSSIFTARS